MSLQPTPEEQASHGGIYEGRPLEPWLLDAADLLAEPDPGPTPMLVDGLIVDQAIVAAVGRWKTTKSYGLLDVCISVATGEPAFGALAVPNPGAVVFVNEESGRAALWRRLDALCRGRAIDRERLRGRLFAAANAGRKLDDEAAQAEFLELGKLLQSRLFVFDPLARMKAAAREENAQTDMAVLIEFVRRLRDETGAAVCFVHHTGHTGAQMRGSSDLESVWETRLTWEREGQSSEVELKAEHREAEAGAPIRYRIAWDQETRTMRFPIIEGDTVAKVRAYLEDHPDASANAVFDALGGKRREVLEAVKNIRAEGGTPDGYQSGTTTSGASERSGTPGAPFRGPGTTSAKPALKAVPNTGTTGVREAVRDAFRNGASTAEIADSYRLSLGEVEALLNGDTP